MIRYRFMFSKQTADEGFLNRVDVIRRLFISNFELYHTGKKYKFSFGPALPYGWISECEFVDVVFARRLDKEYIRSVIEKNLPYGMGLIDFRSIPLHFPSVESSVDIAEIWIELKENFLPCILDMRWIEILYDFRFSEKNVVMFVNYKEGFREKIKNFVKIIDEIFGSRIILRKNLYWIDSKNNLRTFMGGIYG